MTSPAEVIKWSANYPVAYDISDYDPFISLARAGDVCALRRVTQWKNPGQGTPPVAMALSKNKEKSFCRFLKGVPRYLVPGGSAALRADFSKCAPVYSLFWHHILFGTPIFDVHTNRAFQFYTTGILLSGKKAAIPQRGNWMLYDRYTIWFNACLMTLQSIAPSISERQLDRALMQWGIAHK